MTNTLLTLLSTERIAEHTASGYWQTETLYQYARRHASRTPDSFAIRDRGRRLTYQHLCAAADALAADLATHGVRAGQRVGVWLPSRVETAVAVLACARNGYVCCPSLHRSHTAAEVAVLMQRVDASALIVEAGYGADPGDGAAAELETLPTIRKLYRLEASISVQSITPADAFELSAPQPADGDVHGDPNSVVYLAFTSGTTGRPKGVMHTDNTLLANARAMAKDWQFGPASVLYTISPLSHNLGFGGLITALAVGAELVVHDLPKDAGLLERLAETRATFIFGVPANARDLFGEIRSHNSPSLPAVTGFRISGAPVPSNIAAELLQHGIVAQSGYGMTEACSHQYTLPDDDPHLITQTSGRACPGYAVKIFDRENPDTELPAGEIGEIAGRGASLMLGYFDDQQATEQSFNATGWFMTGDLGWLDDNGYLTVTGRKKDVIIRGGHNIYPAHIENLAVRHASVERAAAVPVSDERLGEKVCLIVMSDTQTPAEEILTHLHAEGLSRFDMPEYFAAVGDIPLTASGKIRKRDLLEQIKRGQLVPAAVRWAGPASVATTEPQGA